MISLICGILKNNDKNQTHRYREQIGGCQRWGTGEWAKWVKEVTKRKLPVIKYTVHGDAIYNMMTIVNNTILYI